MQGEMNYFPREAVESTYIDFFLLELCYQQSLLIVENSFLCFL